MPGHKKLHRIALRGYARADQGGHALEPDVAAFKVLPHRASDVALKHLLVPGGKAMRNQADGLLIQQTQCLKLKHGFLRIKHQVAGLIELRLPPAPAKQYRHTSELQSLMRSSYAVFCLKQKNQ